VQDAVGVPCGTLSAKENGISHADARTGKLPVTDSPRRPAAVEPPAVQRWLSHPATPVLGLTVLGAVLRVAHLGSKSLWYDEAVMFRIADGSFGHVMASNASDNSAPPLFALMLWVVIRLGSSEAMLRAIACAAGVLSIPTIYRLARQFVPHPASVFAALLVAVSPSQVLYAQQAREYTLAVLIAMLALLGAVAFVRRPDVAHALGLGGAVILALCTQYGLALLLAGAGVVVAASLAKGHSGRTAWGLWIATQVTGVAFIVACILPLLRRQIASGAGGVGVAAPYLADGFWEGSARSLVRLAGLQTSRILELAFPSLLFLLLCLLGLAAALRRDDRRLVLWLFAVPMGLTFCAALVGLYPYRGHRQALFLTPGTYLLAAVGMAFLVEESRARIVPVLVSALVAGTGVLSVRMYYRDPGREPLRPLVQELRRGLESGDLIYVDHGAIPAFAYYFRDHTVAWVRGPSVRTDSLQAVTAFDRAMAEPGALWVVFTHGMEGARDVLQRRIGPGRAVRTVLDLRESALYRIE
jgi:hypothetical protein